jgi:hypothetical protein
VVTPEALRKSLVAFISVMAFAALLSAAIFAYDGFFPRQKVCVLRGTVEVFVSIVLLIGCGGLFAGFYLVRQGFREPSSKAFYSGAGIVVASSLVLMLAGMHAVRARLHDAERAAYGKMGTEELLGRAREHKDTGAIRALSERRATAAVPVLCDILDNRAEDPTVRLECIWALQFIRDPRALPSLESAARDQDPRIREQAGTALLVIRQDQAEQALDRNTRGGTGAEARP